MDLSLGYIALLLITGLIAGVINILAGGGSNLTLPALMVMGMPADVANATNRLGVAMQNVVGIFGFRKHKKLPTDDLGPIMLPTIIGGILGAVLASYAPVELLKPLLLGAMITMALVILIAPDVVSPPKGTQPYTVKEKPSSWWWLGLAGFYGGFVQAGVGLILIAALAGSLRYDLVRTNALKVACVFMFTSIALLIFILRGQVMWLPGIILACGTMVGAHYGVKLAISVSTRALKWFIFLMTLAASAAALLAG